MSSSKTTDRNSVPKRRAGRNIVLCTDGTGNSAIAATKSNVWRLYQALDLTGNKQLAFYIRGVGTSGNKVLRVLGGVFGFGLANNVRDTYRFLCENYKPPSENYEGDRIFIFGFSRGAFTARLLAGLIARCGILDRSKRIKNSQKNLAIDSKEGMTLAVRIAYASFRIECFKSAPCPTKITRSIRDWLQGPVPDPDSFRRDCCWADTDPSTDQDAASEVVTKSPIEVIGVWDTVSAYGMPITELSLILDRWIFSHRFDDNKLDKSIGHAYHALAIDDERYSFHPLLFDENDPEDAARLTQVWFPGMHSDVGGGYPDSALALTTLHWMINHVARKSNGIGLDFKDTTIKDIESNASSLGQMHNSRSGPAIYYRLAPRSFDEVDKMGNKLVPLPKIHRGVFTRIAEGQGGYAPLIIPTTYEIADTCGTSSDDADPESPSELMDRQCLQKRIQDQVFWRRAMYLASTLCTLVIIATPLACWLDRNSEPTLLTNITPTFLHPWLQTWSANPGWILFWGGLLVGIGFHSRGVKANTDAIAEASWQHLRTFSQQNEAPPAGTFENLAAKIRRSNFTKRCYAFLSLKFIPYLLITVVGLLLAAACGYILMVMGSFLWSGVVQIFGLFN